MSKTTGSFASIPRTLARAAEAFRLADLDTVHALGSAVLSKAPGNLEALWLLTHAALAGDRMAEAADYCRRGLAIDRRHRGFALLLAEAQRRQGQLAEAAQTLRTLLKTDAANADALCNLGGLLIELDELAEAEATLRRALTLASGHPRLLDNLGTVLDRTQRPDEAIAAYTAALHADMAAGGGSPTTRLNLATTLARQGQTEQAVAHYRAALAAAPDNADGWHRLGTVLHQMGLAQEAAASLHKALALTPAQAPLRATLLVDLATVQYDTGAAEQALASLAAARELAPTAALPAIRQGTVLHALGRHAEAAASAHAAAALLDAPAADDYLLASLFVSLGDSDAAQRHIDRYLAAEPDDRLGASLLLAELGVVALPAQASAQWLRRHYAEVASRWDRTDANFPPQLVAAAVRAVLPAPTLRANAEANAAAARDATPAAPSSAAPAATPSGALPGPALDAGCGTGLLGALLADIAGPIDGVDLSPEMIARAREKGVYRNLEIAELSDFLQRRPDTYAVIASAATFIHMAELLPGLRAAHAALRPGGLAVFTLLRGEHSPVAVARFYGEPMDACFMHHPDHVAELAAAAGFELLAITDAVHELDRQQRPVPGLVVSLRKPAT